MFPNKDKIFSKGNWFNLILNIGIYVLIFLFILLSLRYQYFLLEYMEWGDESETIVTSKMMVAGMKLYSEIFNHHGPLTFLPGVLLESFGSFSVSDHRIYIAFFQILAILSIYKSPILISQLSKICASVLSMTIILVFMPLIFGHMYKYQTLVGIFLVIILAQYTLPAILDPKKLSSLWVVLGSFLIISLPFFAITYLPIAGLLFLSSFRFEYFKNIVIGSFLGLVTNLFFLGWYGSFPGYLAFHLYLNTQVLPLYSEVQPGWNLIINAIQSATSNKKHCIALIVLLPSLYLLTKKEDKFPWRTCLLFIGLFSLLMRGTGFHGMPYFYALLPLYALNFRLINTDSLFFQKVSVFFLLICVLKISLIFPGEKEKITSNQVPTKTEFSKLVAEVTNPEDRIIVYSFRNIEYLVSERLPASGYFFYLPWQEKYNEDPKFGIHIDACKDIREAAPKVMYIDKWTVWDKFSWDSYASCVQGVLNSNYYQVPGKPYYIRKDLLLSK